MNINEIEPRFEELQQDLAVLKTRYESKVNLIDDSFQNLAQSLAITETKVADLDKILDTVIQEAENQSVILQALDKQVFDHLKLHADAADTSITSETEPEPEPKDMGFTDDPTKPEPKETATSDRFPTDTPEEAPVLETVDAEAVLKDDIETDVRTYGVQNVVAGLMANPKLKNAREKVMDPSTGELREVQAFRLTDGTFRVPSIEMVERIVAETDIDEIEWVKGVQDCEDISLRFNAKCLELGINSCGRVLSWSGGHCFIICMAYDATGTLVFKFLEPQTDQFLSDEQVGSGMYSLENCLIIIN